MDRIRDRIRGSMLGIAIGDALGAPVECWSRERILAKYPDGIRSFVHNDEHRYASKMKAGSWTDDTQFSITMAEALMECDPFDMDVIARHHIEGMKKAKGAGRTTKEAVKRLEDGVHWSESGKTTDPKLGWGNAGPMKVAPMAWRQFFPRPLRGINNNAVMQMSAMTHYTQMAAFASVVQFQLIQHAIFSNINDFGFDYHLNGILNLIYLWTDDQLGKIGISGFDVSQLAASQDDILERLRLVVDVDRKPDEYSLDWAIKTFDGAGPYVYQSYPMALFCVAKYKGLEALYQAASAGGDTDSTASMAGAILGALYGTALFEENPALVDGLEDKDELLALADRFVDTFEKKDEAGCPSANSVTETNP